MIVFASCDSKYLLEHGRAFIVSAYKVGFWAYINIINPTKEAFKLLDSLPCTYSIEYTINPTKTYYACSRFHSFPVVEELLICDIDCFFNKPFDPPKEDVGLFLRENENEMINEKISQVYFEKKIPVHITKKDGEWLNGLISEVNSDFLMIKEFKKGEIPVFFLQIQEIERYITNSNEKEEIKDG